MADTATNLRERKKKLARRNIIHQANRLFRLRGYEAVTLEQVADRCALSMRTILRYFPTKEALALAIEHDLQGQFRLRLDSREVDTVTCWREFNAETVGLMEAPEARQRMNSIFASPSLFAEFLRISQGYEDMLAEAIQEESRAVEPLEAALFATMLVSSTSAAFRQWLAHDEPFDLAVLDRIVDSIVEMFDP